MFVSGVEGYFSFSHRKLMTGWAIQIGIKTKSFFFIRLNDVLSIQINFFTPFRKFNIYFLVEIARVSMVLHKQTNNDIFVQRLWQAVNEENIFAISKTFQHLYF